MQHVNVYGPAASGKTRNSHAIARKYECQYIIDEGHFPPGATLTPAPNYRRRALILTREPIIGRGLRVIKIEEALK